MADFC